MKIKCVKINDGKILLKGEDEEFYLMDGIYRRDDGETFTIKNHQIVDVIKTPDFDKASKGQIESYVANLEKQLQTVGEDAQLANIDLQNALQRQQRTIQTLSNVSKMMHDTAMAVIRNMR